MKAKEIQDMICHIMQGDYNVVRQEAGRGDLYCFSINHPYLRAGFHFYINHNHIYRHHDGWDIGTKINLNQKQAKALYEWAEEKSQK